MVFSVPKRNKKVGGVEKKKKKENKENKSTSAAQDPRSTVQFNPPLFWTIFFLGGGDFGGGIFFSGVGVICFGGEIFFGGVDLFFTVQYSAVQYSTI